MRCPVDHGPIAIALTVAEHPPVPATVSDAIARLDAGGEGEDVSTRGGGVLNEVWLELAEYLALRERLRRANDWAWVQKAAGHANIATTIGYCRDKPEDTAAVGQGLTFFSKSRRKPS